MIDINYVMKYIKLFDLLGFPTIIPLFILKLVDKRTKDSLASYRKNIPNFVSFLGNILDLPAPVLKIVLVLLLQINGQ